MDNNKSAHNEDQQPAAGLPSGVLARIQMSWLALFIERFWPALWPSSGIAAVFLILALLNVFSALPGWLHMLALLGFAAGVGLSLIWPIRGQLLPNRQSALRHLEKSSGLEHRPITGLDDLIGLRADEQSGAALWRAHRQQLFSRIRNLKIRWPSINLASRDPYALRILVLILLLAAAIAAGGEGPERIAAAFNTGRAQAPWSARADAFVVPPPYTGEELKALPLGAQSIQAPTFVVPEGSELAVRVHGTGGVALLRTGPISGTVPDPQPADFRDAGANTLEARVKLNRDLSARFTLGGLQAGQWKFDTVPDTAPHIAFQTPLAIMQSQSLRFHFSVKDDYGVTEAVARVKLVDAPRMPGDPATEFEFELPLPPQPARSGESTLFKDLTAHRWAGLPVAVTLRAKDARGHSLETAPLKIVLPERIFHKPLARALVEQRRSLVRDPRSAPIVAKVLDAFAIAPERFTPDPATYLGLRAAYYRVARSKSRRDLESAEELLWSIAMHVEEGDVAEAQAELRRIQEELAKALSEGAPDEEIASLMQQLRAAIQNFVQAMQSQGLTAQQTIPGGDAQALRPQDLKSMIDQIETLARSGSRDAAQQMLSQLQSTLESLRNQRTQGDPQEQAAQGALNGLRDLMNEQRNLMDKTLREQSQAAGSTQAGATKQRAQALAEEQGRLNAKLGQLMQQMSKAGANTQALQSARSSMQAASENLGEGAFGEAQDNQGKAIEELRRSGDALMRAMQARAAQRGGSAGADGMGAGDNQDPFGRPGPSFGPQTGNSVKIPAKMDIQRAREILEELQRRASERGRPGTELEYLERLLRRF
jgi:uncharacterized protein (TIGR02302 family)